MVPPFSNQRGHQPWFKKQSEEFSEFWFHRFQGFMILSPSTTHSWKLYNKREEIRWIPLSVSPGQFAVLLFKFLCSSSSSTYQPH